MIRTDGNPTIAHRLAGLPPEAPVGDGEALVYGGALRDARAASAALRNLGSWAHLTDSERLDIGCALAAVAYIANRQAEIAEERHVPRCSRM